MFTYISKYWWLKYTNGFRSLLSKYEEKTGILYLIVSFNQFNGVKFPYDFIKKRHTESVFVLFGPVNKGRKTPKEESKIKTKCQ